jgi:hypothetical protein
MGQKAALEAMGMLVRVALGEVDSNVKYTIWEELLMPAYKDNKLRWILLATWSVMFFLTFLYVWIALRHTNAAFSEIGFTLPTFSNAQETIICLLGITGVFQFVWLTMKKNLRGKDVIIENATILEMYKPWSIRWAVLHSLPIWGLLLVFGYRDSGMITPWFLVATVGFLVSYPFKKKTIFVKPSVATEKRPKSL